MKHALTTHVLDTSRGRPAAGVRVRLYRGDALLVTTQTNSDGRCDASLLEGAAFTPGSYRIEFEIGDFFVASGAPDGGRFLKVVPVVFQVDDPTVGYHVPLLATPWSYATYRGS